MIARGDAAAPDEPRPVRVAVLIVTYGDRWRYLHETLRRLQREHSVAQVVVVDNASVRPITQLVREHALDEFVHVLTSDSNRGSARGYEWALHHALDCTGVTHAYLLDDDNLPEPGAVDKLAARAARHDPATAFVSFRPSRVEHRRLMDQHIPVAMQEPNSFLGFHAGSELTRRLGSALGRGRRGAAKMPEEVDYAPYGGFFFALERLAAVGFPRTEFVLYVDDHEFTYRFVQTGGRILFCAESRLEDLEPSWQGVQRAKVPPLFDPQNAEFRVFYATRNRVAFERELLVRSPAKYWLNAGLKIAWSALRARAAGVPDKELLQRARLLARALRAGWKRELGPDARARVPGA
jgi:GT2 family glycosyltransferase